jgi:hypothetical protein
MMQKNYWNIARKVRLKILIFNLRLQLTMKTSLNIYFGLPPIVFIKKVRVNNYVCVSNCIKVDDLIQELILGVFKQEERDLLECAHWAKNIKH